MGTVQFHDGVVLFGDAELNDTDKVAMHEDCCCEGEWEDCRACLGAAPSVWRVVIANHECAAANNTFILATSGTAESPEHYCYWFYTFGEHICGAPCSEYTSISLYVQETSKVLKVYFQHHANLEVRYMKTWETEVPCDELINEDIPHSPFIGDDGCGTTSTCTVTALL